jgi:cytoskeletal protein RodZ
MAMGCYLLLSVLMCLLFWPLGIVMLLIGIISAVTSQSKASTRELKRIALLSATPEVRAAEAERERKQQKAQLTSILIIFAVIGALGVFGWIGSTINKAKTNAVVAATPYVTPTPYYQPDITPTPQAEVEKDARQRPEREQQWADHESNQKVASTPTPTPARLRMESAEADLNRAWQSLTSQRRAQLNQEERNWIRHRDSLPAEEQIKTTAQRATYLWSLVSRTFDD